MNRYAANIDTSNVLYSPRVRATVTNMSIRNKYTMMSFLLSSESHVFLFRIALPLKIPYTLVTVRGVAEY